MPFPTDEWQQGVFLMNCFYAFFGTICAILNLFCILAIYDGKIIQKNSSFIMIAALCWSNLLSGVSFTIMGLMRIAVQLDGTVGFYQLTCFISNLPSRVSGTLGCYFMLIIAAERFYCVAFPLHYRAHHPKVVKSTLIVTLIVSLCLIGGEFSGVSATLKLAVCNASTAHADKAYWQIINYLTRTVPIVISCVAYVGMVGVYWWRKPKTTAGSVSHDVQRAGQQKQQHEMMMVALLICTLYVLCNGGAVFLSTFVTPYLDSNKAGAIVSNLGGILTIINGIADVFVYPAKNAFVKKAMKTTLKRFSCQSDKVEPHLKRTENSQHASGTEGEARSSRGTKTSSRQATQPTLSGISVEISTSHA